jgi:hypothetical protein
MRMRVIYAAEVLPDLALTSSSREAISFKKV